MKFVHLPQGVFTGHIKHEIHELGYENLPPLPPPLSPWGSTYEFMDAVCNFLWCRLDKARIDGLMAGSKTPGKV